jgi:hypothetical protein
LVHLITEKQNPGSARPLPPGWSGLWKQTGEPVAPWVNPSRRIVLGKVENAPPTLSWKDNYGRDGRVPTEKEEQEDHDPPSVLKHITEQTGLSFTEEARPVRVLFVERVEK